MNKLIKNGKFENWKREWKVSVRDFRPQWVYEMAEIATRKYFNDPFKLNFKRSKENSFSLDKKKSKVHFSMSQSSMNNSSQLYKNRQGFVKENIFPIFKEDMKRDVEKTGERAADAK